MFDLENGVRMAPARGKRMCGSCGVIVIASQRICIACGASLTGPFAPRPGAPRHDPAATGRAGVLWGAIAAVIAIATLLALLVTVPGCASAPAREPAAAMAVPSILGQSKIEAEGTLVKAGFQPHFTTRYAEYGAECVIEQKPDAGTLLAPPGPVVVVVATASPE